MAQTSLDHKNRKDRVKDVFNKFWIQLRSVNSATVIYVLLALGLILLLAWPFVGQAIIGLVAGYLFAEEIIAYTWTVKYAIEHDEVTRGVVLGVLIIAFFIEAPFIIIGAAVAIAIKRLITDRYLGRRR